MVFGGGKSIWGLGMDLSQLETENFNYTISKCKFKSIRMKLKFGLAVQDGIVTIHPKFEPSPRYFCAFLDAHFCAPNEVCFYMNIEQGIIRLYPKVHTNQRYFCLIAILVKA